MSRKSRWKTRNIGIMAHIDAAKQQLRSVFCFTPDGYIVLARQMVATMDWMVQEQERVLPSPPLLLRHWKGHRINIIDTPGHVDFTVEVERSLRFWMSDSSLLCRGVEPQSETVWRQADRYGVPRIAYINKMRVGADFPRCGHDQRQTGANPYPFNCPSVRKINLRELLI